MGRTDEEIRAARETWMKGDRFGEVKGYDAPGWTRRRSRRPS
ncbi:hypothetical protein [Streptomyces tanashiensis]|nr:hypothetical protein [Streptomyces tanashiensis]